MLACLFISNGSIFFLPKKKLQQAFNVGLYLPLDYTYIWARQRKISDTYDSTFVLIGHSISVGL